MTFLSSRFGKVAAGALVAGALALGGAGAANADDTAPVDSTEVVIGDGSDDGSNWTPPPAPGPGDLPGTDIPVEETPEPETPVEETPPTIPAPPAEDTGCEKHDGKHDHKHGNKHEDKKSSNGKKLAKGHHKFH